MGKKRTKGLAEYAPSEKGGDGVEQKQRKRKRKNDADLKQNQKGGLMASEIPTVSIAVPGSIIDNTQSLELATRLAGQIARAATIYRIDEIVVFDNKGGSEDQSFEMENHSEEDESCAAFLLRILRYLETPQYLRKSLFPIHKSLRFVGMLPPLDAPHHLRKHEWACYREGITLEKVDHSSPGTLVDVGLSKNIMIDQVLEPGKRVTVEMGEDRDLSAGPRKIVPRSRPKEEGMYWGYRVRYASAISSVFKKCPYQGGYDHLIGTSEHGSVIRSSDLVLPSFRHLLIAFGGLAGLEECIEEDETLKGKTVHDVFDSYLNTCPNQGSRTIRTEEAIFISLQYFHEPISVVRR